MTMAPEGNQNSQVYAMGILNITLLMTSSVLTILGSSLIIITYIAFKNIQTPLRHIIVCISLSDLFCVLANLSGVFMKPVRHSDPGTDFKCILQSFVGTSSVLSSFLWTIMLALSLYIIIVWDRPDIVVKLLHPWSHLFCWLVPLMINITALSLLKLGNSGDATSSGWCWIRLVNLKKEQKIDAVVWMFVDGKGIEILTYFVLLFLYLRIKCHLYQQINKSCRSESSFMTKRTVSAARKVDNKILFVPLLLILLRIWGTIRFLLFILDDHQTGVMLKILISMQAVGDNLQGFTNCVLFCFCTSSVNHQLRDALHVFCQHLNEKVNV